MHYGNLLSIFKIDWDTYDELKREEDVDIVVINDKNNYRKAIKLLPTFNECIYQTYGPRGPLVYVLQKSSDVTSDMGDHLDANSYNGTSGNLHEELVNIFTQN